MSLPGRWLLALVLGANTSAHKTLWREVVVLSSDGSLLEFDIGEAVFNTLFRSCPVVQYRRNGGVHSVYLRTGLFEGCTFNAYRLFTDTWTQDNNQLNLNARIFDNLDAAKANRNAWVHCDEDPQLGIGYPKNCGKLLTSPGEWFSMPWRRRAPGLTAGAALDIYFGPDCPIRRVQPAHINIYQWTFWQTGCPANATCDQVSTWIWSSADAQVVRDQMYTLCDLASRGYASIGQNMICCGTEDRCRPSSCVRRLSWAKRPQPSAHQQMSPPRMVNLAPQISDVEAAKRAECIHYSDDGIPRFCSGEKKERKLTKISQARIAPKRVIAIEDHQDSFCHMLLRPRTRWAARRHRGACGPSNVELIPTFLKGFNYKHKLIVDVRRKIAFCPIQKVASLQFTDLFNTLNGFNRSIAAECDLCCGWLRPTKHGGSLPVCAGNSKAGRYNLSRSEIIRPNSGWRLAAFVRDPFERFVSAFIFLCCLATDLESPCQVFLGKRAREAHGSPPLHVRVPCSRDTPIERQLELFHQTVQSWAGEEFHTIEPDGHFRRQEAVIAKECGFPTDRIDFLGHLGKDREENQKQVREMLSLFGVAGHASAELAAEYFPASGRAKGFADRHFADTKRKLDRFHHGPSSELAYAYLRRDYEFLHGARDRIRHFFFK